MTELKVFTVEQMAEMLQCTEQTVVNYIKQGKLGAFLIGRDYRITEKRFI